VFLTPTLTQLPRPGRLTGILNEPDFDKYIATWTDAAFLVSVQFFRPACDFLCQRPGPKTTFRSACSSLDVTAMKPRSFAFRATRTGEPWNQRQPSNLCGRLGRAAMDRLGHLKTKWEGSRHVEALDTDRRRCLWPRCPSLGPRTVPATQKTCTELLAFYKNCLSHSILHCLTDGHNPRKIGRYHDRVFADGFQSSLRIAMLVRLQAEAAVTRTSKSSWLMATVDVAKQNNDVRDLLARASTHSFGPVE